MDILINATYGVFGFSDEFRAVFPELASHGNRSSSELIAAVKAFGLEEASGLFSRLEIVSIPDDATDWRIQEYDGAETVIYVQDGYLHEV